METPTPKVTTPAKDPKTGPPLVYATVFSQVTILPFNCDQCGLCWLDTDHSWGTPVYQKQFPPCPRCQARIDTAVEVEKQVEAKHESLRESSSALQVAYENSKAEHFREAAEIVRTHMIQRDGRLAAEQVVDRLQEEAKKLEEASG